MSKIPLLLYLKSYSFGDANGDFLDKFPYPALLLDNQERILAFNAHFARLPSKTDQPDLLKNHPLREWVGLCEGCYRFKTKVNFNARKLNLLILLAPEKVVEILEEDGKKIQLTNTELNILIRRAQGESLKQIAIKDNVAHATRQDQSKSILKKTGMTNSTDLMSSVNTQISAHLFSALYNIMLQDNCDEYEKQTNTLIEKAYGNSCRRIEEFSEQFPRFVLYDIGPKTGDPVLVYHPGFYATWPFPDFVHILYKQNIRLLLPVRPGYCGAMSKSTGPVDEALLEQFARMTDKTLDKMGIGPVSVLSITRGTLWAAKYLATTKRQIDAALFASAQLPFNCHVRSEKKAPLNPSIKSIAEHYPSMVKWAMQVQSLLLSTPNLMKKGMLRSYKDYPVDNLVAKDMVAYEFSVSWFMKATKFNFDGITSDLLLDCLTLSSDLDAIERPVHFLHGVDDQDTPIGTLQQLVEPFDHCSLESLSNTGHLYTITDPAFVLDRLASLR